MGSLLPSEMLALTAAPFSDLVILWLPFIEGGFVNTQWRCPLCPSQVFARVRLLAAPSRSLLARGGFAKPIRCASPVLPLLFETGGFIFPAPFLWGFSVFVWGELFLPLWLVFPIIFWPSVIIRSFWSCFVTAWFCVWLVFGRSCLSVYMSVFIAIFISFHL